MPGFLGWGSGKFQSLDDKARRLSLLDSLAFGGAIKADYMLKMDSLQRTQIKQGENDRIHNHKPGLLVSGYDWARISRVSEG